jgi:peptidyl-prolyl cis-trans isomerase C
MSYLGVSIKAMQLRFFCLYSALFFNLFLLATANLQAADLIQGPVVAIVDDFKFYLSDVKKARQRLSPEGKKYPLKTVYKFLLDDLVDTYLIVADARRQGLDKDDEVVNKLRRIEKQILHQSYLAKHVSAFLTDKKLKTSYQAYVKSLTTSEEIRARHILVQTREQAIEIINRLGKGEIFSALAKSVSTGPSGKQGGDLGYFTRERMVPSFSAAAFTTPVGEITTKPVKTQFGWHVIKVEDKRLQKPKSFVAIKSELRQELNKKLIKKMLVKLRKGANIKFFDPNGK